jgi:hypothetical protein
MAGLKKQKKEKSSSPNVVLVIFLVFFFLLSIGLGIWGYYGYAGQEDLRRAKHNEYTAKNAEKLGKRFYAMQYRYLRSALGDSLDEKESGQLNEDLDEFYKDNAGIFNGETDKEAARKLLADLKKSLGSPEDVRDFKTNFPKELKTARDKAAEWEGKVAAANAKAERMEKLSERLTKNQEEFFEKTSDRINKDNAAQLAIVKEQSENFKKATALNKELTALLEEEKDKLGKMEEDRSKEVGKLKAMVKRLEAERRELAGAGGGGAMNVGKSGDASPLLLDISTGKPLWDQPVGKITRVDLDLRQVAINLGSAQGAKPELTFNIFGANAAGRAEKQLKGSIEIIKVVDASTSLARITSLYDGEGREILMNLQTRGRILRESEAPIREGDLLFNLFWGTRVAVVGYVSITGEPSDSPAEQNRQMEDFMHLLRRNGMQVDAYVDLRDGQIRGNITAKTRYLIQGAAMRSAAKAPAAKAPDDDKEKEPAKDAAPNTDRNDLINKSSQTLYNDARDRGLLMISAENFATVIGYRRARSANSLEISNFRPSLPDAGSVEAGGVVARPKDEEKK